MESVSTEPLTLTPSMEAEVEEWLRTVGGTWVHSQEEKHGVPADAWFAHIHHATRQSWKLAGGLNPWNSYQRWWKHCQPEGERPLGSNNEGMSYILCLDCTLKVIVSAQIESSKNHVRVP